MTDVRDAGFKSVTRVADARRRLLDAATPHERTDSVVTADAAGRALATDVTATTDVPHYRRAAMDGWAVRASDTFGAGDRSPAILRADAAGADSVAPETAVRVHTGSALPEGADAVVMIEETDRFGDDVEVFDAVAQGENVSPVGEDVTEGEHLFDAGHRLRASDLGLLRSTGVRTVEVYDAPDIAVIPTGEELVTADPEPGEVVETNGLTVSRLVEGWGGSARYRDVVTDDRDSLAEAIERDLDADVVVTTGGSSVGERDLLPAVVDDLGEVLVHGVALQPGHPGGLGMVEGTPVVMLPGYPVACIVNAVQFLRPLLKHVGHLPDAPHPTREARLDRKIRSEVGVRTFVRVRLSETTDGEAASEDEEASDGDDDTADLPTATPTRAGGAGVLSSVALSDGWVVVPESREGVPAGETVTVADWEFQP
ncbi:gephyrin-like molybdotransferase Glp [Halomarina salina]|uniref:Gephyrin-like molybdotransferase Glp n=1 Tax=Halomarina salina TaxID=1872699 RepID=A0ABD5RPS8_9EURY|nr:gephyrin-like molybdotransferase Glp [Halomarina salina]